MQDVIFDTIEDFSCPNCGEALKGMVLEPFRTFTCPFCNTEIEIPAQFGPYILIKRLGDGIMTSLFEAKDTTLDRMVSIKVLNYVLSKNQELVEAFKREALAAASLNSANVLKVYEFGIQNKQPYMVMEHIKGEFLHEVMRREHLSESRVLNIVEGIVQGLADTHECGILHGDIMPRNLLIAPDGTPKLSDFGLARFQGQDAGDIEDWSSPYYMPPERIRGEPEDHRSDFYSLGTTLYYLLCDDLPFFDLEDEVVMRRKIDEPAPDPRQIRPNITPEFAELTLMLLHRDPNDRPADYNTLFDLLAQVRQAVQNNDEPLAPSAPRAHEVKSQAVLPRKKAPWMVYLLLALGAFGLWGVWRLHAYRQNQLQVDPDLIGVFPTATPRPRSTPIPTPTPLPLATATPALAPPPPPPSPTPLPQPAPPAAPTQAELEWDRVFHLDLAGMAPDGPQTFRIFRDGDFYLRQDEVEFRPRVQPAALNGMPALAFDASLLISNVHLTDEEEFTLILVAFPRAQPTAEDIQLIAGVEHGPHQGGGLLILHNPAMPGSLAFQTQRGSGRLSLTRAERNFPTVIAVRRDETRDTAYAGTHRLELTGSPPQVAPDRSPPLQTLQVGGLMDRGVHFQGWIAELIIYRRALSDGEIDWILHALEQKYGVNP